MREVAIIAVSTDVIIMTSPPSSTRLLADYHYDAYQGALHGGMTHVAGTASRVGLRVCEM